MKWHYGILAGDPILFPLGFDDPDARVVEVYTSDDDKILGYILVEEDDSYAPEENELQKLPVYALRLELVTPDEESGPYKFEGKPTPDDEGDDEVIHTCRNCDKPISGGEYCSNLCADMDKLPPPKDIRERLTGQ